ncbi:MAG: hypothetical protein AAGF95_21610, partial [Chloroflexota bacterium]
CALHPAKGARPFEPRWQRCTRQTTRKRCPSFNYALIFSSFIPVDKPNGAKLHSEWLRGVHHISSAETLECRATCHTHNE